MVIKTSDTQRVSSFLDRLYLPPAQSHKGQNGKVLVIGGSSLFHAASIWAAEVSSYFVDMVHYSSTVENNKIMLSLKKKFRNGIVVPRDHIEEYVREDDAILVGPGMLRGKTQEAQYTKQLVKRLIEKFPKKRFAFDAGALQMIDAKWLKLLEQPAIITPQQREFEMLFGINVRRMNNELRIKNVEMIANEYHCVILLKAVDDIISDGKITHVVQGGNAGLTKGGTGDILAGLTTSFYAKNDPILSSVLASILLKKTAEKLFLRQKYWYNNRTLIEEIPKTLGRLG